MSDTSSTESAVAAHYARDSLLETILDGARAAGADPDNLTTADLAPVDEFHTAGRITTLRALDLAQFPQGARVLDIGSGLGGAARTMASERGHDVDGIDLTPHYVETARALTERLGLSERCRFHLGSALDLPFADGGFDAATTFHVAMNIKDRVRMYAEARRVLRPGGSFLLFDVMKGPAPGVPYPMPWADQTETSFLHTADETRMMLNEAGFEPVAEENLRDLAIEFFRTALANVRENGPPPLGLHLLMGPSTPVKFGNFLKAFETHQIEPVMIVARAPSQASSP